MNLPPVSILFLGYVTLLVIGIGPSLWFISHQNARRVALAMCIAPVVGLAETGLIFYPLILHDLVIRQTAYPVTTLAVMLSVGLTVFDVRHHSESYARIANRKAIFFVGLAFMASLLLLLLPPLIGGTQTQYWQSSPWDATSYMKMADYAQNLPVSFSLAPDHYQDILKYNPAFSAVFKSGLDLMLARPEASNTLAWLSTLYGLPIYSSYYFLKLLFVSLIFGPALAVGLQLKMPLHWSAACAVVLVLGFWTGLVVDIDALSQVSSLSLNLLVFFALLSLERKSPGSIFSRQHVFVGFTLAAAMAFYPESFFLTAVAVGLYYVLGMVYKRHRWKQNIVFFGELLVISVITLFFQSPDLGVTLNFMFGQATIANNTQVGWPLWYFGWLTDGGQPFRDIWGLHFFQYFPQSAASRVERLLVSGLGVTTVFIGVVLSFVIIIGIVRSLFHRKAIHVDKLFAAYVSVFWGTGLILLLRQQPWVAGKALSMGFPFVVIAVFFYSQSIFQKIHITISVFSNTRRYSQTIQVFRIALILWFISQLIVPLLRSVEYAVPGKYPLYANLIASQPVANIALAAKSIVSYPSHLLGIDVTDYTNPGSPLVTVWTLAVADLTKTASLSGDGGYITWPPIYWQNSDAVPDQLLLSPERNFLARLHLGHILVNDQAYFRLSTVTGAELDQAVMFPSITDPSSPAAIEVTDAEQPYLINGQGQPARWTLQRNFTGVPSPEQTLLRFWASGNTLFSVYLRYTPNFKGNLNIITNGTPTMQQAFTSTETQQAVFCVGKPGINTIALNYTVNELLTLGRKDQRLLLRDALFAANGKVDVGMEAEQLLVGVGWYAPEKRDTTQVRWSGKDAQLTLLTCKPPTKLRFRAFVPDSKVRVVTLSLNGKALGDVKLNVGWHEYALPIPANTYLPNGKQTLDLSHDSAEVPPNDTRSLAAAYDWFVLE